MVSAFSVHRLLHLDFVHVVYRVAKEMKERGVTCCGHKRRDQSRILSFVVQSAH